jgi:hypothetical protein
MAQERTDSTIAFEIIVYPPFFHLLTIFYHKNAKNAMRGERKLSFLIKREDKCKLNAKCRMQNAKFKLTFRQRGQGLGGA